MLVDLQEKCTRQQLGALKLSLDWTPMILGDGHIVGSFSQKCYCEECNTMPLRDGPWYLSSKSNGKKIWVCPACVAPFKIRECRFLLGMKC
eukprot:3909875-Karenia_brevis.AAC.1